MRVNMTENPNSGNNKKALAFLEKLYANTTINLVAIDPNSLNVTGITRPVDDRGIKEFIERHNGSRNIYFMVNMPTDDAPDNKLKKKHVARIRAVWLDADPIKGKDFNEERERLLLFAKDLMKSDRPPTVIIDSGSGIQAFWYLNESVEATPENVTLYEAYSRSLSEQYDTDKVHNIDRIMRVPFTWNLPTQKKKDMGRVTTLSKSTRIGARYA